MAQEEALLHDARKQCGNESRFKFRTDYSGAQDIWKSRLNLCKKHTRLSVLHFIYCKFSFNFQRNHEDKCTNL